MAHIAVMGAVIGFPSLVAVPAHAALPGDDGTVLAGDIISGDYQGTATENTDGSNLDEFTVGSGHPDQGQTPAWAPDGSRIVLESGEGGVESSLPDGTGQYAISEGVDRQPTFTADGAYVIASGDTDIQQLEYTPSTWQSYEHQGSSDMKPWFSAGTGGNDYYPTVSATTGTVYFEHDTDSGKDIWTDHGTHTAGPLIPDGQQPDVSPDGTRLAFVRSVSGYEQLFVQNSDGSGTATQLTSGPANHDYPKWSPDGSTLYYNYNPGTDYSQTVGHELVLATSQDTETPNGLAFVTARPVPRPVQSSTFHAVTPTRVLDTRKAVGVSTTTPLAARGTLRLALPDGEPVPEGATAVVMNVTVTQPAASGYLAVYPDGQSRPSSSNLNWSSGETIPNQVIVPVGPDGTVDFYNGSSGTVHVIADVSGYYTAGTTGATYTPVAPTRLLDTRAAVGVGTKTPVAANGTVRLQVEGRSPVPADGVTAVVLNVTVTQPTATGYLTAYPDGSGVPNASNLNWTNGRTIANHVVVPVGSDGEVDLRNGSSGTVQVVADVFGYYTADSTGAAFHTAGPARLMDTRTGSPVAADGTVSLDFAASVVPAGTTAVVLNVTVAGPQDSGYLTVYPDGQSRPGSSNLNWVTGETIPNLVTVPVGSDGKVDFYSHSSGTTQVVADVFGYFTR